MLEQIDRIGLGIFAGVGAWVVGEGGSAGAWLALRRCCVTTMAIPPSGIPIIHRVTAWIPKAEI
jgi:hypothetical protein